MSSRVLMLGFILSRMLNPLSYTVFILFFILIFVSAGTVIPKPPLQGVAEFINPCYVAVYMTGLLAHGIVIGLAVNFIYRVIAEGKYIVKLSTFGFLLAISIVQIFTHFCMNALPQAAVPGEMERQLELFIRQNALGYFELSSLLCMGLMLALYVGILSRGKFKKNIGFIDDTLCE